MEKEIVVGALAALLSLAGADHASADFQVQDGFESADAREPTALPPHWHVEGSAGVTFSVHGQDPAMEGRFSGVVRSAAGWNSLHRDPVYLEGLGCTASIWLRRSSNGVQNVYFSALDAHSGAVIAEAGPLNGAQIPAVQAAEEGDGISIWGKHSFWLAAEQLRRWVTFRIGVRGNGEDAWIGADNLEVVCDVPPSA